MIDAVTIQRALLSNELFGREAADQDDLEQMALSAAEGVAAVLRAALPTKSQIAEALDLVQLWCRVNDLLDPPKIEVCRYGADHEDEIIVISRHDTKWKTHDLLRNAIRDARADAILALFDDRTPTLTQPKEPTAS